MGIFSIRRGSASIGMMYRQLSIMIASGVPVSEAIHVLAEESEHRGIKNISTSISRDLESGVTLNDSLRKFPSVFNEFLIFLFEHPEEKKKISEALNDLADEIENGAVIKSKLSRALFIPAMSLAIGLFLLGVISIFVIPVFKDMFDSMGGQLPVPTQMVIGISGWVGRYFLILIACLIVLVIFLIKSKKGVYVFGSFVPGVSGLMRQRTLILFARRLSVIHAFGVSWSEAIKNAAEALKNVVHAQKISEHSDKVSDAEQLGTALKATGLFPRSILQMIRYGSKSDDLPLILNNISRFYEKNFDRALLLFLGWIEIGSIIVVGFVIGFIVIALYLPIFTMAGMVS